MTKIGSLNSAPCGTKWKMQSWSSVDPLKVGTVATSDEVLMPILIRVKGKLPVGNTTN